MGPDPQSDNGVGPVGTQILITKNPRVEVLIAQVLIDRPNLVPYCHSPKWRRLTGQMEDYKQRFRRPV